MKKLFCLFLMLCLFTAPARAEDLVDRVFSASDSTAVEDAVPETARELLDGTGIRRDLDFAGSLRNMARRFRDHAADSLRDSLAGGLRLCAAAALCALAGAVAEDRQREIRLAGTLAVTLLAAGDVNVLLGLGRETVTELAAFGKVLMPVLSAAAVASGATGTAGVIYTAVMFVIDVLIVLLADVMMPLVWAVLALTTAGSVSGNEGLHQLARSVKNGITLLLRAVLGVFVCYLMAGSLITGTTDAMAVKTVKLALSTSIPAAGNVMADAAEAVVAGAGIVRSVTGSFGILAILAAATVPLLRLAVQYLIFRAAAIFSAAVGAGMLQRQLEGLGNVFSLILTLTGSGAALLLIGVFAAAAGVRA